MSLDGYRGGCGEEYKEGFGTKQGSNTPTPSGVGGRIVCASRHPPRPLEAWMLGGLDVRRLGELND